MNKQIFNDEMLAFLDTCVTPFHAVDKMESMLQNNSFKKLYETDKWDLKFGNKYYVTRGDSSIIAFIYTKDMGCNIIGAHTDSPTLKIQPQTKIYKEEISQLGVEVYGGALLNPWFDRDLSIAGKVYFTCKDKAIKSQLIDFKKALAIIPSLAIHLDSEANKNKSINKQTDILPIVCMSKKFNLTKELLRLLPDATEILSFELSLYDTNKATYVGFYDDFISSARLDNLISCFVATKAICKTDTPMMMICSNHEEVGSVSVSGADGSFVSDVLQRLYPDIQDRVIFARKSLFISSDNAHAIHPNYPSKHDLNYAPKLNQGVVIKVNANERYASNGSTIAKIKNIAKKQKINTQIFLTRNDMRCGSTIGPIISAKLGIDAIDIGVPTYAMHSIRESCGSDDAYELYKLFMAL